MAYFQGRTVSFREGIQDCLTQIPLPIWTNQALRETCLDFREAQFSHKTELHEISFFFVGYLSPPKKKTKLQHYQGFFWATFEHVIANDCSITSFLLAKFYDNSLQFPYFRTLEGAPFPQNSHGFVSKGQLEPSESLLHL